LKVQTLSFYPRKIGRLLMAFEKGMNEILFVSQRQKRKENEENKACNISFVFACVFHLA